MIAISCTRCSRMIILDPSTTNNLNPYCIDCQQFDLKINRDKKIKFFFYNI